MVDSTHGAGGSRRSSIVDVARLAGVSKQTVSNVLNGRIGYTPETKDRVLRAMEELSYQPRQAARTLRSHRTMQLGYHMLGSQLEGQTGFTASLVQALIREVTKRGYDLLVFSGSDGNDVVSLENLTASGSVDGFLLSDIGTRDPRPRLLAERGVPFATFGRVPAGVAPRWIDIDNVAAIGEVVDYLVGLGHSDIGFVRPDDHQYWTGEREEGFLAALERHGLSVRTSWMFRGSRPDAREFTRRLLGRKRRPTAIVTSNDAYGADVINAAHAVGLDAGSELAVTGFGGSPISQVTYPTLTTVRIPVEDIAARLVDLCLRAAEGAPTEGSQILPTELWKGGSA